MDRCWWALIKNEEHSSMNTSTDFSQVQKFFQSWGLAPMHEESYKNGLAAFDLRRVNAMCYARMKVEAVKLFRKEFVDFITREMTVSNGDYHLVVNTWGNLREDWEGFNK